MKTRADWYNTILNKENIPLIVFKILDDWGRNEKQLKETIELLKALLFKENKHIFIKYNKLMEKLK